MHFLVLENETLKILLDFEIEMNHPIPASRLDLVLNNKKRTYHLVNFFYVSWPQSENASMQKDGQIPGFG